jgi:hypothetical protein
MANLPKGSDAKLEGLIADSYLCNGSQLPKEKFFICSYLMLKPKRQTCLKTGTQS